jgi:hypothetical protein
MATTDFTNGVTLSDAGWADDVDCAAYSVLSSVVGTNTITATGPATYTYAATRHAVWLTPANTNTGATTINITPSGGSALGAKNVFHNGAACFGGELQQNVPVAIIYDGTQFNIVAGGITQATQAQLEAGSATTSVVTPGRQHFHPSASKGWVKFSNSGAVSASYNVTSITDGGVGNLTVNWATDFSSAHYAVVASGSRDDGSLLIVYLSALGAGTTQVLSRDAAGSDKDGDTYHVVAFGDHA